MVLKVIRNIRIGIKTLMLHKLRSLLTTLGVVFGVSSVIAMLAVGEGASREALERIRKLGSNIIILSSEKPMEDDAATRETSMMSIYGLLYDDELRIKESIPYVIRTVPVRTMRKEARLGQRSMELRVMGTTPDWFDLVKRPLLAGRLLNIQDMERLAPVCVLTERGARRLLATQNTIGEYIRIGSDSFEVVGILEGDDGTGGTQRLDRDGDVYIPMNTALQRFGERILQRATGALELELVELHQIIVEVESTEKVEIVAEAIHAMLQRFHPREDYRIEVPLALLRQAEETRRTFNIVLGSIAGISLLVGGIGIMNIMLASVTERTREIGIRRAIGAKQRQIIGQFLIETVVLSSLGGLIGLGIGALIPWIITQAAGMPTYITPYSLVLAVGISVSIGVIFGLYPAVRAARLDPITALRHE